MCTILLSINPEHVDNIFNGKKLYEYRKTKCKRKVDKIIIYSTFPVMKVVGEADVDNILEEEPEKIWEKTKSKSGINKKFFDEYYKNSIYAVAYKLVNIIRYEDPKNLQEFGVSKPPQSFLYLEQPRQLSFTCI